MVQPPFGVHNGYLWECYKALPGLRTASRSFQDHTAKKYAEADGLACERSKEEPCAYMNRQNMVKISVTQQRPTINRSFQTSPRTPLKTTNSNRRMIYDMAFPKKPALTFLDDVSIESKSISERLGLSEIHQKGFVYAFATNDL